MDARQKKWAITLVSALLLLGMGWTAHQRPNPVSAEPFHARIRQMAKTIPYQIGDWNGQDNLIPVAAVKLLKPNIQLSRLYINSKTRRSASFLLIQSKDAHDLVGHYPPVCYPNSGSTLVTSRPRTWQVGDLTIQGRVYEFTKKNQDGFDVVTQISNFMILPNGHISGDMQFVQEMAFNFTTRYFGAAQVQVVHGPLSQAQSDQVFHDLVSANLHVIKALTLGITP